MKTKFRTSPENKQVAKIDKLLKNNNFRNSQRYIKDSKNILYYKYNKKYYNVGFFLILGLPLIILTLLFIIDILGILSGILYYIFTIIFILYFCVLIFSLFFGVERINRLVSNKLNKIIYLKPYNLAHNKKHFILIK